MLNVRCPAHIDYLNMHNTLSPFTNEETEALRSWVPKFTQLFTDREGVWTWRVWLQRLHTSILGWVDSHPWRAVFQPLLEVLRSLHFFHNSCLFSFSHADLFSSTQILSIWFLGSVQDPLLSFSCFFPGDLINFYGFNATLILMILKFIFPAPNMHIWLPALHATGMSLRYLKLGMFKRNAYSSPWNFVSPQTFSYGNSPKLGLALLSLCTHISSPSLTPEIPSWQRFSHLTSTLHLHSQLLPHTFL